MSAVKVRTFRQDERIGRWLADCEREDRAHRILGWVGMGLVVTFVAACLTLTVEFL
jgi:hypothetical protein